MGDGGARALSREARGEVGHTSTRDRSRRPSSWPGRARGSSSTLAAACGIVTCGGLCPGLNDVIRAVVLSLHSPLRRAADLRFPLRLRGAGASATATARWSSPPAVGGHASTSRAARSSARRAGRRTRPRWSTPWSSWRSTSSSPSAATAPCRGRRRSPRRRRGADCSIAVIGIPKTIDNDISFVQTRPSASRPPSPRRSGPSTRPTREADGRAQRHRPGEADGPRLRLHRRLRHARRQRGELLPGAGGAVHAGRLPARPEGAARRRAATPWWSWPRAPGQDLLASDGRARRLGQRRSSATSAPSCGTRSTSTSRKAGIELNLKYIDPSYIIRSVPANPHDSGLLPAARAERGARRHGAAAPNMVVGFWNHEFTHVPIALAASAAQEDRSARDWLWSSVLAATGQPRD